MKTSSFPPGSFALIAAFAVALLFALFTDVHYGYERHLQFTRAQDVRATTNATLRALETVMIELLDLETGARGYLATGNEIFLEPFQNARKTITEDMELIKPTSESDAAALAVIRQNTGREVELLTAAVQNRRAGTSVKLMQQQLIVSKNLMDALRAEISSAQESKRSQLVQLAADRWDSERNATNALMARGILGVLLITVFAFLLARDTVRKQQLLSSAALLSSIVHSSSDAIISTDLSGTVRSWNRAAEKLFGYSVQEVEGKHISILSASPEQRQQQKQYMELMMQTGRAQTYECERISKDGRCLTISVALFPTYLRGKMVGLSSITRDMTESRRIRAQLDYTTRLLDKFVQCIPHPVYLVSADSRIIFVNPAWEHVVGVPISEALGKTIREVFSGEVAALIEKNNEAVLEKAETLQVEEFLREENRTRYFKSAKFLVPSDDPNSQLLAGISVEITSLKEAESSLRALSARLMQAHEEERARIARDLHDTTAQHLSAAAMLLSHVDRGPNSIEGLGKVQEMIGQALSEVRALSYFFRPPMLDEVGLPAALEWLARGIEERTDLTVSLDLDLDMRLSEQVELTLFRIAQEALSNVHRHSGSKIADVCLKRSEGEVTLKVSDDGRGFRSEILQCPVASGVGLASMRERLRFVGGNLTLRNEGGAVIEATVPIHS